MLSIKRKINKLLKDKKLYSRIKFGSSKGIFRADFCPSQEIDFIANIETLMSSGTSIKNDRATTLVRLNYAGKDIVIKRYNYQGILHAIRHTIKGTRAKNVWGNSHFLLEAGIKTPIPLAYITTQKHGISGQSYIINEYIDAPHLGELIHRNQIDTRIKDLINNFCNLLEQNLKQLKISHNDLKPANILIKDNKVYLIDLDGMKLHSSKLHFTHRHNKDIATLKRRILTPTNTANDQ